MYWIGKTQSETKLLLGSSTVYIRSAYFLIYIIYFGLRFPAKLLVDDISLFAAFENASETATDLNKDLENKKMSPSVEDVR